MNGNSSKRLLRVIISTSTHMKQLRGWTIITFAWARLAIDGCTGNEAMGAQLRRRFGIERLNFHLCAYIMKYTRVLMLNICIIWILQSSWRERQVCMHENVAKCCVLCCVLVYSPRSNLIWVLQIFWIDFAGRTKKSPDVSIAAIMQVLRQWQALSYAVRCRHALGQHLW